MTDTATFLADAWVSLCAALGALVVLTHLGDLVQRHEIARRFRFCLWLLVALMIARIGHWSGWGWVFSATATICAGLIPLAALLLAEGLMRRHAPPVLKQACAWGAFGFAVLGILQFHALETLRWAGLLVFQLTALGAIAWFVLRRDRASLSWLENRTIDRINLSFLLILPFLATDYMRFPTLDVPVRLGGVAVLALCWLSIGMNRSGLRASDIVRNFAIVAAVTGVLTLILAGIAPMDVRAGIQVMAVVVSTLILLAIWQAAIALRIEDRQLIALREIANAEGHGEDASLAFLRRAAGVTNAVLVAAPDLADMVLDDLRRQFAVNPVQQVGVTDDEQVNWLFERFSATHAVLLSDAPFRVVIMNSPDLALLDNTGSGLRAVQRMAGILVAGENS